MNESLRRLLFLPEQASTFASKVDSLHYFVIITTLLVSTAVGLTALLFFVRFRRRSETQTTPLLNPPWWLETLFVVVPLSFFLAWFARGYRDYVEMRNPPKSAMDIYVQAKQWMWKFSYPGGPNGIGVLRVPANRPVRLLMTSRDVIHSFYVPAFRVKQDVLPGRYSETWFEAVEVGRYQLLCAEYCGTNHSNMRAEVIVLHPEEFDNWLADQRRGRALQQDGAPSTEEEPIAQADLVRQGEALAVRFGCVKCHSIDGSPHIGPTWLDLYLRREPLEGGQTIIADEGYLTESMMEPRAKIVRGFDPVMPTFKGRLAGAEVAAIVEFIKSLRSQPLEQARSRRPVYEPIRPR
jgi:cytochrome c oxidase subunit II